MTEGHHDLKPLRIGQLDYKKDDIRLNLSENLLGWDESDLQSFFSTLTSDDLVYYPNGMDEQLKVTVLDFLGLKDDIEVLWGNGSFDLLNVLFQVFALPAAKVLTSAPDFFMYPRLAKIYASTLHQVAVDASLTLSMVEFITASQEIKPSLIFLSNPNNPTTQVIKKEDIECLLNSTQAVVVIDEAYGFYAGESVASLVADYEKLIVIQTVSKIGLAGLRLGYLLCQHSMAEKINKIILPFPVNTLSLKLVSHLLGQKNIIKKRIKKTIEQRNDLTKKIQSLGGFKVYESHANFLNVSHDVLSTEQLHRILKDNKIIVTPSHIPAFLPNCVRIGLGQDWQNEVLLNALSSIK